MKKTHIVIEKVSGVFNDDEMQVVFQDCNGRRYSRNFDNASIQLYVDTRQTIVLSFENGGHYASWRKPSLNIRMPQEIARELAKALSSLYM